MKASRLIIKCEVRSDIKFGDSAVFVFDDGSSERLTLPDDMARFNELDEFFRTDQPVWSKEMG